MSDRQGFLHKAYHLLIAAPEDAEAALLIRHPGGLQVLTLDHEKPLTEEQRHELIHLLQAACMMLAPDLDDDEDCEDDDWEGSPDGPDVPALSAAPYSDDDLDRTPRH